MQLSNYLKPKGGLRRPTLHIDLFPSLAEQELTGLLNQRIQLMPGVTAEELMTGFVHKRIGSAVCKAAKLPAHLSPADLPALAHAFKDWQFAGLTPLGWQQAQTIGSAVCKAAKLPVRLSPADSPVLAHTFKDWQFAGLTPLGWQQAQTTGGGMGLSQLYPESFMVRTMPGLYVVGETLDAAGSCGGFNLHWAFGSGIAAGRHAAAHSSPRKKKR